MLELFTVNIKADKPSVEIARKRLNDAIETARRRGVRAMKVIHGYGSTGTGGAIKTALLASLRKRKKEGKVVAYIAGDKWHIFDRATQELIDVVPSLERDRDLIAGNEGITIILLSIPSKA